MSLSSYATYKSIHRYLIFCAVWLEHPSNGLDRSLIIVLLVRIVAVGYAVQRVKMPWVAVGCCMHIRTDERMGLLHISLKHNNTFNSTAKCAAKTGITT